VYDPYVCKIQVAPDQVPFLAGSLEWDAYIYANPQNATAGAPRVVKKLRLLQVDVAARDIRVDATTGGFSGHSFMAVLSAETIRVQNYVL
jgi:hypothetical protein